MYLLIVNLSFWFSNIWKPTDTGCSTLCQIQVQVTIFNAQVQLCHPAPPSQPLWPPLWHHWVSSPHPCSSLHDQYLLLSSLLPPWNVQEPSCLHWLQYNSCIILLHCKTNALQVMWNSRKEKECNFILFQSLWWIFNKSWPTWCYLWRKKNLFHLSGNLDCFFPHTVARYSGGNSK